MTRLEYRIRCIILGWRGTNQCSDDFLKFWYVSPPNTSDISNVGYLFQNGTHDGLLGEIQQYEYIFFSNFTAIKCPYFEQQTDVLSMQEQVVSILGELNTEFFTDIMKSPLLYALPDGAAMFNFLDPQSGVLEFDMMINDNGNYLRKGANDSSSDRIRVLTNTLMTRVSTAFMLYNNVTPVAASVQPMPYYQQPDNLKLMDILGASLFPFALTFLLPVFMNTIVMEKEMRLREMMKMMGMQMRTYWLINYLYNYMVYALVCIVFVITEVIFQVRFFTQSSPLLLFLLFFLWGHAMISFCFLLTVPFSKSQSASRMKLWCNLTRLVFGYLLVIISVIVGEVLNSIVYALPDKAPVWYMVYPLFTFFRGIYLMFMSCTNFECTQWDSLTADSEITSVLFYLLGQAVVCSILTLYLDAVVPQEYGVRSSPLFFLKPIFNLFKKEEPVEKQSLTTNTEVDIEQEEQDTDVQEEKQRVSNGLDPKYYPIIIQDIVKKYNPQKTAVNHVYLGIEKGQCFGLLGPNGAGKTSIISMLTGLYPPTSGTAIVAGHDITKDISRVHQYLGVCPQFDVLWENLTPKEHVLFYARLKGVAAKDEETHVMQLLKEVGLEKEAERKMAKELSGGMKRRLSVAMALAGNPLIDEPTTGLDPLSRRQLWDILSKTNRTGKCLILTTHSMEEADVLCTKIGIITFGQLRCLGPQTHLKNKFGRGYRLTIITQENADKQNVKSYINEVLPAASLKSSFEECMTFEVPVQGLNLGKLFVQLENEKNKYAIKEWGISQTSLEDVFLTIVKDNNDDS